MTSVTKDRDDGAAAAGDDTRLHRVMGPWLLLLFVVGDILGTGIYALTGKVAAEVGTVVWLPFLVAFLLAAVTACSYLELVTKFPKAAGAALYTQKAFGIHFLTFIVAFAVMSSGITSAATASQAFAENLLGAFGLDEPGWFGVTGIALVFVGLLAAVNLRGVSESVRLNVIFTCVELTGLLIIIMIGAVALGGGQGDFGRAFDFSGSGGDGLFWPVIAATTLAFFAMVGFEDSVNMAEESKDPRRTFPRVLLAGLFITGVIYLLVSVTAVALVPVEELGEGATPLLKVVEAGAPWFPLSVFGIITMLAVGNSALINMLMASRLLYGMGEEGVLPRVFSQLNGRRVPVVGVVFTSLLAAGLVTFVGAVPALGGTTSLLLLAVFTLVNAAVLVLRRGGESGRGDHFRSPWGLPWLGVVSCAFFVGPWTGRDPVEYLIAGVLLGVGVALWVLTTAFMRREAAAE
ncbi:APC family permease [Pseudooceanicola sp.]|uniref:APC family permease n=1 Tax=Pseudooceanicola sp. TaxID=1914328 RepID=UPI00405830D2